MKPKIFLFILIITNFFLLNTILVDACSCLPPSSPKVSLEEANAVFAGKVIDIDTPNGISIGGADPVRVIFEVSEIWKGSDFKTVTITTARDSTSCGYPFRKGEEYIVYAYSEGGELSTNLCSRTNLLANAKEDLEELGSGNLPANPGSDYVYPKSNLVQILSIIAIVLILIVFITWIIRKHKK